MATEFWSPAQVMFGPFVFSFQFLVLISELTKLQRLQNTAARLVATLRSVQFLASFIIFYFEILSYLACGEKIIRLAFRNIVKLSEKSTSDF